MFIVQPSVMLHYPHIHVKISLSKGYTAYIQPVYIQNIKKKGMLKHLWPTLFPCTKKERRHRKIFHRSINHSPFPFPPRLVLVPTMRHTLPNIRFPVTCKFHAPGPAATPRAVHFRTASSCWGLVVNRECRAGRERISTALTGRNRAVQSTYFGV